MKYCKSCAKDLPLNAFGKRSASPDGLSYKCKECQTKYNKDRWANEPEHREKAIKRAAIWASKNKEKRRLIASTYDEKNREKKSLQGCADAKRRRLENPERERMLGRMAAQRRRHRAVGNNSFPHPLVAARLLKAADGKCTYCGLIFEKLTLDHFHPVSKGGDGCSANMVPCCQKCNSSKKDKDGPAWIEKRFGIARLVVVYWRLEKLSTTRFP